MPLLRGIARTAVVAGTATAVSNRVSRRQAERWGAQDESYYEPAPPPPAPAPAAPAPAPSDPLEQLQKLGELKAAGVLTDAEFEAQKAKILAG
jgi:Short C-terminal domain